jgi:hypothetical protein
MENDKTLGQTRVMAEFNPSKTENVDIIKNKCAELIDVLEEMKCNDVFQKNFNEKNRIIEIAQTYIETACMYAVKANFIKTND